MKKSAAAASAATSKQGTDFAHELKMNMESGSGILQQKLRRRSLSERRKSDIDDVVDENGNNDFDAILDQALVHEEAAEKDKDIKHKIKGAKPRYLNFQKRLTNKLRQENCTAEGRKDFRIWDTVASEAAIVAFDENEQNRRRPKKEWIPPNWEKILARLKDEGRDIASIDAGLREIQKEQFQSKNEGEDSVTSKRTGKYLMPEDIEWCRLRTKFGEKDLLHWFRKFRSESNKGQLNAEGMKRLFPSAFPLGNAETFAEIVYKCLDIKKENRLDFKDFIRAWDVVCRKETADKMTWAFTIYDHQSRKGWIDRAGLKTILRLLDEVEGKGFVSGATDEDKEALHCRDAR